jgi:hypothetical protein
MSRYIKHTIEIDIPEGEDPLRFMYEMLHDLICVNLENITGTLSEKFPINEQARQAAVDAYRKNIADLKHMKNSIHIVA